ncbi:MAG: tetratricopeptide repeat protein, partial [Deltaproteobacteria bacterium]
MTLLVVLLLSAPGHASPAQEAFEAGVTASRDGDNAAAVEHFVDALDHGGRDPAVYHGLGNALFRQGHNGHAIAAWTRGLELAPTDGDLSANRALALSKTRDRLELPRPPTGPFFWQAFVPVRTEALLAGLAAALGLWVQLIQGIADRRRRRAIRRRWEAAVLVGIGLVLAASARHHLSRPPPATVLTPEVRVRSALGAEGVDLFVLHEGAVVQTLEVYEDADTAAVLVALPDDRKGWVPRSAVDIADP